MHFFVQNPIYSCSSRVRDPHLMKIKASSSRASLVDQLVLGRFKGFVFFLCSFLPVGLCAGESFSVSGGGFSSPYFTFTDGDGQTPDFSTQPLYRGETYEFNASGVSTSHPFMIGESYGDTSSSLVSGGPISGSSGTITVTIPSDFNGSLYYFCTNHSGMIQEFTIATPNHVADLNASVSLEMIWVEPGTFTMGSPLSERDREYFEIQTGVTLTKGFYLGKYEVTQAQYEAVMTGNTDGLSATPSKWPNNPNHPVERVSYEDIRKFFIRLNAQQADNIPEGWAYVLPTEAQWEYACRAGTTTAYSWGDSIFSQHANFRDSGFNETVEVGTYAANPWGFFDMHGNLKEWTADWKSTQVSGGIDPEGPATGAGRVVRGGSWSTYGRYLRSAYRLGLSSSGRMESTGFRLSFRQVPPDTIRPELELFGGTEVLHELDEPWNEPGYAASDERDGNLTNSVAISPTLDVNTSGTYILTYTVADAAGNETNVTRTVRVVDHLLELNSTVNMEMIWVEPGSFTMGQVGVDYSEPEHNVTLTQGFYLGKYEVTQAQYEAVMTGNSDGLSASPSHFSGNPDYPVEKVSWDDIQVFLTRLNEQQVESLPDGWAYVLRTEAQWEYACRAGTSTAYSWGDSISASDANYNRRFSQTTKIGSYSANPWGFFDMHGNVQEWTSNWYVNYISGAVTDPEGPAAGPARVFRGGSWIFTGTFLRSAIRNANFPSYRNNDSGFRVCFQQIPADVTSPEMQIFGDSNITHLQDTAWVDPGAEAHDVRDGNITSNISVNGSVDVNTTGTYTLTYTVSDAAGNNASITRTVHVGIPANYATDLNSTVSLEMIWVESGTFTIGQNDITNASPEHNITFTQGFYLSKYEVTQAHYEAVMSGITGDQNSTPSNWHGNPNRPVENVSWEDVQVFLTRLNEQQADNLAFGWEYVLPTEAQWEYACRAGTNTPYSWGDTITTDNASFSSSGYSQTRDVGLYDANPWGFFDMHGNVWEWTADAWGAYASGSQTDPFNAGATGSNRVLRGGSWSNVDTDLLSARRHSDFPSRRTDDIGFRVVFKQLPDTISPELELFGETDFPHELGDAWAEPGYAASDKRDGNLTDSVTISGTPNINTSGTYSLSYTVADAAGNEANATRTVR